MKCDKAELLISAYLDGELTASDWSQVERHLSGCSRCAATLALFQKNTAAFKQTLTQRAPESDLWAGIAVRLDDAPIPKSGLDLRSAWRTFWQGFVVAPTPAIRFVQGGLVAAALLLLILRPQFQAPTPDTTIAPQTDLIPASPIPSADKQKFMQASLTSQVEDYLERAGMLLMEINNSGDELDASDVPGLRTTSQSLLEETIVVKKQLAQTQSKELSYTVDQLEMLLFDMANLNDKPQNDEFNQLRAMVIQQDLVIKIEIYDARQLRQETRMKPSEDETRI